LSNKYYIGLSANFHDPAISLVNDKGEIVFAEAIERYLQNKRALSTAVDTIFYVDEILKRYPFSDYEIALNWTNGDSLFKFLKAATAVYIIKNYTRFTKWLGRRLKFDGDEFAGFINFSSSSHSPGSSMKQGRACLFPKKKEKR